MSGIQFCHFMFFSRKSEITRNCLVFDELDNVVITEDFDLVEESCDATNTTTSNLEDKQEASITTLSSTTVRIMKSRYKILRKKR